MIRTFTDQMKQPHTLDLDAVQVDSVRCIGAQATEQSIQFELQTGEAVTCELAPFWHDIAGPELSAQEAGLLLAECLMRQVIIQRMGAGLRDVLAVLTRTTAFPAEIPSSAWLTTRLDPLARQAMSAYDGSDATTNMLARILQQEPATILQWARQLGLEIPALSKAVEEPPREAETEPLPALVSAAPEAVESREASESKQFSWTPERRLMLEEALKTCIGTTVIERAREIAALHRWPETSVRSKLYEMNRLQRADQSACREMGETSAEPVASDRLRDDNQPIPDSSSSPALVAGNCLWTVTCSGNQVRWALDYRYGTFPLEVGQ
ncbi:MAG TPA: hypothetical protein VF458_20390, partial [Ktedonobacteraceae bacterium]